MSQSAIPSDWLTKFSDPYAVLGVSIAADDRRVLKRYRTVAKLLHPDAYALADEVTKDLSSQLFARFVSPAYQKLKQEKGRKENVSLLRLQVRRLYRDAPINPKGELARQLMQEPVNGFDVFYEQAIVQLAESQYQPLQQFESLTQQINELNLIYLQLKMGDVLIREKPTGLVSAAEAKPIQFTNTAVATETVSESYAQRHYRRAQDYMKKGNWKEAEQELRDAIKIEVDKSEYHALLGVAYLHQNLQSMAKVYLRQALKLNPADPLACRFAPKLGIEVAAAVKQPNGKAATSQATERTTKDGGLFGLFRAKK